MKKILSIALLLLAAGCQPINPLPPKPVACTQEAKACPDGSFVSRTGPNCEFSACPPAKTPTSTPITTQSGIEGKILLGPTCPVERIPPDPACAPRGYEATVIVKTADGQKEIKRFTSQANGSFKVDLSAGTYLLVPLNTNTLPRGSEQTVAVEKDKYSEVTINFDSGIR